MRLILAVFDALRSFDRPATRRELERESGLGKDDVHAGLRGLARRALVVKELLPCRGGTYRLCPGAQRPADLRGRFPRDAEYRNRLRRAYLDFQAARPAGGARARGAHALQSSSAGAVALGDGFIPTGPSVARPTGTASAPGVLRVVVRGVLDLQHTNDRPPAGPCLLAEFWRKR